LVVPGREAHREALVATLQVARSLLRAARSPLRERLPQGRHHGDRGGEDAIGALRTQELEDHFGAVQHSPFWHLILRAAELRRIVMPRMLTTVVMAVNAPAWSMIRRGGDLTMSDAPTF